MTFCFPRRSQAGKICSACGGHSTRVHMVHDNRPDTPRGPREVCDVCYATLRRSARAGLLGRRVPESDE